LWPKIGAGWHAGLNESGRGHIVTVVPASDVNPQRHTFVRMMFRAVRLRCPWCASRRTFVRGWFGRHDRCRTCGIRWRREEWFELGAVIMNTFATFIMLTVFMVIGFVRTSPDIPVLPFVLGLAVVAVVVPIVIYPFTYTMWLAFDLAVHPPEAVEIDEAQTFRV
jgi:uncharacterized protein (DUF983 family)